MRVIKRDGDSAIPTQLWEDAIGRCEDAVEFETLLREHGSYYEEWSVYINGLLQGRNLSVRDIADGCGISESTAKRLLRAIPSKRDNVIKIAAMLSLTIEQTDVLLTRRAKYQKLYPKNPDDAIWMYILKNGGSASPDRDFHELKNTFMKLCEMFDGAAVKAGQSVDTHIVGENLLSNPDKSAFIYAMYTMMPAFSEGYRELYNYIEELIREKGASANTLFEKNPNFRKLHYIQMENLKKHECPTRTYLLALGIHLGLNADGINALLQKAGMGGICSKDRLEAAIFFFLEELNCRNPDAFFIPSGLHSDGGGIFEFRCDTSAFSDGEVDEDSLADYIRCRLEELNIPLDGRISIERILELL